MAREQEAQNVRAGVDPNGPPSGAGPSSDAKPSSSTAGASSNPNQVPGMSVSFDPVETARKIYPILEFRDKIVRAINRTISKIPGLEKLIEHISETLTAFVLGLLAPFVRPIINQVSKVLKDGSSGVISASAKSQLEPWTDPHCTNPTHSMLSKDHFTNVLNSCAGRVAATVLQYAVPRVLYAWDNTGVPVDEVVNDVLHAFHHPVIRDERNQIQREMFETVRRWANEYPRRNDLNHLLSSQSVKDGKNHVLANGQTAPGGGGHSHGSGGGGHSHGSGGGGSTWSNLSKLTNLGNLGNLTGGGSGGSSSVANAIFSQFKTRDLDAMDGRDGNASSNYMSASPAPGGSASSPAFGYSGGGNGGSSSSASAAPPSGGAADAYLRPQAAGGGGGQQQQHYQQQQPPHEQYQQHHQQYQQQPPQGFYGGGPPQGGPPFGNYGPPPPGWGGPGGPPPPPAYGFQGGPPPPGYGGQPGYGQPPYGQQGPPGGWGQRQY